MSLTTVIGTMVVPLGMLAALGLVYIASRFYGCRDEQPKQRAASQN